MNNINTKTYRDNGAIGALLDEYEKSINELCTVISDINDTNLSTIVDHQTNDEDCRSIQTILNHVVRAGYGYAIYIRKHQGEQIPFVKPPLQHTAERYFYSLKSMFQYTEKLFKDYPNLILEEHDTSKKIFTSWGQYYDVEQLMEHAIVHILRHRRQIERFLMELKA